VAQGAGPTRRARKGGRGSTSLLSLTANGDKMETEKELVRDGFARRYVRYDKAGDFTDAEREAREKRRGLWADPNPVPPWEFRREKRAAAGSR
jgi:endonuclease YncB( thermonuclease family)